MQLLARENHHLSEQSSQAWKHSSGTIGLWNGLPVDLLLSVANSLQDDDRLVMACVCAAWKETLGMDPIKISFAWAGTRTMDAHYGQALVLLDYPKPESSQPLINSSCCTTHRGVCASGAGASCFRFDIE